MESERLIRLVVQAQDGDKKALEELYLNTYSRTYRLALRILKNSEDAEDITQEVFITVQQNISGLREPVAYYAWVNRITANKCNRFFNRHKGLIRADDENELESIIDDDMEFMPDKAIDDKAGRKIIMEVIDNLPDNQRMCILLFYYGQLAIADIAVALDTNENTVKSRLSLARAKIRTALEEKAKKDGIKLWGVPLVLTPIVHEAMESMNVPHDVYVRLRECISEYGGSGSSDALQTKSEADYANQPPEQTAANYNPKIGAESSASFSATTSGATLGINSIIAIICGVVLTTAAATIIFWEQISEIFSAGNNAVGIIAEVEQDRVTDNNVPDDYVIIDGERFSTSLTRLYLNDRGLTDEDIVPLRYMVNLVFLQITNNQITDISPIAGLTSLRAINFNGNQISDISPIVGLYNLTHVYFSNNQISDISPLAELVDLSLVHFISNQISDISPLTGFTNLHSVHFSGNQISDITPLADFSNLRTTGFSHNQITDISPLTGLTNLVFLNLGGNQITDISPITEMTNLTRLFLWGNQITDITPLEGLTNLFELHLSRNNQITDLTPLVGLTDLIILH